MESEGQLLESFPDGKITTAALATLEKSDAIRTAIPLISEAHDGKELSDRVVVQTDSTAVVGVYNKNSGWRVEHRIDSEGRDPKAVLDEAMIKGQGETSLVETPDE